jgi:hypothetical protein
MKSQEQQDAAPNAAEVETPKENVAMMIDLLIPSAPEPDPELSFMVKRSFALSGNRFFNMIYKFKELLSFPNFIRAYTELVRLGWQESIADWFADEFNCPGDSDELRKEIAQAAVAVLYVFPDGSVLQADEDRVRVCRRSSLAQEAERSKVAKKEAA